MKRQAIRCRDPKIKPMEGAILQVSVPDAGSRRLLGNCWRDERRSEHNKHQRNEMFEHD